MDRETRYWMPLGALLVCACWVLALFGWLWPYLEEK